MADPPDLVDGEDVSVAYVNTQPVRKFGARCNSNNTWHALGFARVNLDDSRMRMGARYQFGVQHSREFDIECVGCGSSDFEVGIILRDGFSNVTHFICLSISVVQYDALSSRFNRIVPEDIQHQV